MEAALRWTFNKLIVTNTHREADEEDMHDGLSSRSPPPELSPRSELTHLPLPGGRWLLASADAAYADAPAPPLQATQAGSRPTSASTAACLAHGRAALPARRGADRGCDARS